MRLQEYREKQGMSYEKLADFLGIPKTTTVSICRGMGRVSLENAVVIREKTGGAVDYNDLLIKG